MKNWKHLCKFGSTFIRSKPLNKLGHVCNFQILSILTMTYVPPIEKTHLHTSIFYILPKTIKIYLLGTIPISSKSYQWRKKCNPEQYAEFLRDGKILAEVLAAACPTPLGQAKVLSKDPSDRERIEKVIYDLFDFGVQPSNLFEPDDLLKSRNIPQVSRPIMLLIYYK